MDKIDLKKKLTRLYNTPVGKCLTVEVPAFNFLMIEGQGNPNTSQEYSQAIDALYTVAYTLKFQSKKAGFDYTVMPLEGLWYSANPEAFLQGDKDAWQWTMMIMQPSLISQEMVDEAMTVAARKKDLQALSRLHFQLFAEGLSAQVMYIGPYAEEHPTIMKLHQFIDNEGCRLSGCHHEIYLNDPRKTAPSKLKTIIRHPMIKK